MSIEKLVEALERNKIGAAQVLLDQGVDPNSGSLVETPWGYLVETPLCAAIKKRNLVAVKLLLDCGADANYQCQIENNCGDHPLSLASMTGNLDILKTLLKTQYKANVLQKNEHGGSIALHTAARHSEEAALYLIDSGTTEIALRQLYARDRLGKRLLDLYGNDFYIREPIGEPDEEINKSGVSVHKVRLRTGELEKIFVSAQTGDLSALKRCLKKESEDTAVSCVNQRNQIGDTPLHCAIRTGKFAMVKYLVEQKADRLVPNDRGWIPLHMARRWNREDAVKCLLSNTEMEIIEKQELARDAEGRTPTYFNHQHRHSLVMSIGQLVEALEHDDIGAAQVVLDAGVDPNSGSFVDTPWGYLVKTPLCTAIKKRNLVAVKFMLDCKADANYQCRIEKDYGDHPLSLATKADNLDILKTLMEYIANVLQKDEHSGSIALHTAARHSEEAALHLIDSCTTETALRQLYACDRFEKNLLDLYGDDSYIRGPDGEINTSGMSVHKVRQRTGELEKIFVAAGTGDLEALKQYAKENNNDTGVRSVNQRNQIGDTPLHCAIRTGHFPTVEFLLVKKKADRLVCNDREWIALHMAARWNRTDIAQCLLSNTDLKMFGKQMLARNAEGQIPAQLCANFDHINLINYFNRLVIDKFTSLTICHRNGINITLYWIEEFYMDEDLSKIVVEMIPGQDGDDSRANKLAETLRGVLADYVETQHMDSHRPSDVCCIWNKRLPNGDAHGQDDDYCRLVDSTVDSIHGHLLRLVAGYVAWQNNTGIHNARMTADITSLV